MFALSFICNSCSVAADAAAFADIIPEGGALNDGIRSMATEIGQRHDNCRGATWCDCQHKVARRP